MGVKRLNRRDKSEVHLYAQTSGEDLFPKQSIFNVVDVVGGYNLLAGVFSFSFLSNGLPAL